MLTMAGIAKDRRMTNLIKRWGRGMFLKFRVIVKTVKYTKETSVLFKLGLSKRLV